MKKILSALVLLTTGYYAFPQNLKSSLISGNPEISVSPAVSKTAEPTSTTYLNNISIKAVRDFKKTFKNITNENWYTMPDGYRVNFTDEGMRSRLDYDKKGNWLHSIRYYDEKKLSAELRRLIVSSYLDYNIRSVEEVKSPRNTIFYIIHLEGQKNWINIKIGDYEIYELRKINKSF